MSGELSERDGLQVSGGAPARPQDAGADDRRKTMREDYALERLPTNWRWGSRTVFMVLAGIITAFFFPATGGEFLLSYGATATFIGLGIAFLILTGGSDFGVVAALGMAHPDRHPVRGGGSPVHSV